MQRKIYRNLAFSGIMASLLAACASPQPSFGPTVLRNPIKVTESVERLELYTRADGLELSARDKFAVGQFLEGYRASGDGPLYINMPSSGQSHLGAQQAETMVTTLMAQSGINMAALQTGQYQVAENTPAPVIVSYRTLRAIPQDCRFMDDISRTYTNQVTQSFGCSASANLAAMVADPRQFLEPYAMGEPNTQRRIVVYDKFIKGEVTASPRPPEQATTFEK